MAITTLPIGKPYNYTYGAGNVVNRQINFEKEAGIDTIKARISTLPEKYLVTTVNDIIVKVWGAWGNRDARLSDLSVVQQNRVFDNLSRGRMEITRNDTTGGLIIYLPLRKSSFFAKNTKKNERAT